YTIDSFPIPVCRNIRINRCKIYQEEIYRGLISSKKEYFFGIRAHMICTVKREPIEIIFAPGAVSDAKIFQEFEFDLPSGSKLYGDKMYNNYHVEDRLKSISNIDVLPIRKSNLKRQHTPELTRDIKKKRKSIETTFSQITNLFPKKIHAVTNHGFELKVFSFILAYSFMML
ncbi:IS982 family transposase, partial [Candidatus Babeliales bacterium]|nr:IS982 family transposase [Candidatus Babeliales bacterium]